MLFNVLNDQVIKCPTKEVELSLCSLHSRFFIIRNGNAVPSTEWVKTLFGIGFEFELIFIEDLETTIIHYVNSEILLGVVSDKPINNT